MTEEESQLAFRMSVRPHHPGIKRFAPHGKPQGETQLCKALTLLPAAPLPINTVSSNVIATK